MPKKRPYNPLRYDLDRSFLDECGAKGVVVCDKQADIGAKSELISMLYPALVGLGGRHIPVDDCSPERIGSAFIDIYEQAKKRIAKYERIPPEQRETRLEYLTGVEQRQLDRSVFDIGLDERISIMLECCSDDELARIAKKFGKDVLGGYAERLEAQNNIK